MERTEQSLHRRTVLKRTGGLAAVTATGVAGCLGGDESDGEGSDDGGGEAGDGDGDDGEAGDGGDGGEFDEEFDITLGSTYEPGHVAVETAEQFKEIVEERTDGAFSVEVVPGGAYGAEDEVTEQCADGIIEMHSTGGLPFFMYAPEYYFFDVPFIIEDLDHMRRVLDSDEFQPAHDQVKEDGNQRQVGVRYYRGIRHFTSNEPVRGPDDVQGMNLRLPELDSWVEIWSEIGADPTPVALDELYSALQTGVADASEGPPEQVNSFNLFEVQDYYSLTSHMVQTGALYMNEDFFQGLDDNYQDLVLEAAEEASRAGSETAREREQDLIDELEAEGMEIVEDADTEAFRDAAEPAVEELFETEWEGTWDQWRDI